MKNPDPKRHGIQYAGGQGDHTLKASVSEPKGQPGGRSLRFTGHGGRRGQVMGCHASSPTGTREGSIHNGGGSGGGRGSGLTRVRIRTQRWLRGCGFGGRGLKW